MSSFLGFLPFPFLSPFCPFLCFPNVSGLPLVFLLSAFGLVSTCPPFSLVPFLLSLWSVFSPSFSVPRFLPLFSPFFSCIGSGTSLVCLCPPGGARVRLPSVSGGGLQGVEDVFLKFS